MDKIEELENFVKKYNISNDDLIKFSSLSHELKKLSFSSIIRKEAIKIELYKIKTNCGIGFMDYGNFILCCKKSPIITIENFNPLNILFFKVLIRISLKMLFGSPHTIIKDLLFIYLCTIVNSFIK